MQGHIVFQKTLPKNKYILIYTTLLYKDQKKTINDAFNNTIFGPEVRPQPTTLCRNAESEDR